MFMCLEKFDCPCLVMFMLLRSKDKNDIHYMYSKQSREI